MTAIRGGLDDLLAPGRTLRDLGGGLRSALPADDQGAAYDRRAALYDRLIGAALYNRLVWGTHPSQYSDFAAQAERAGTGPLLDAGAGTAVFTAALYRHSARPIVVTDRSVDMLRRAGERLDGSADLVQADVHDLPFADGAFATVGCFGVLHVLPSVRAAVRSLLRCVAPGGRLFVSSLVAETRVGTRYLRVLERAGEVVPPRTEAELRADLEAGADGAAIELRRTGSMAYAVLAPRG